MFTITAENRLGMIVLDSNGHQISSSQANCGYSFIPDPKSFFGGWWPLMDQFVMSILPVMHYSGLGWVFDLETDLKIASSNDQRIGWVFEGKNTGGNILNILTPNQTGFMFLGGESWIEVGN